MKIEVAEKNLVMSVANFRFAMDTGNHVEYMLRGKVIEVSKNGV